MLKLTNCSSPTSKLASEIKVTQSVMYKPKGVATKCNVCAGTVKK